MSTIIKGWVSPYKVVRVKTSHLFRVYNIEFDDSILFKDLNKDSADFLAAALNGAYNMGRQYELSTRE